MKKKMISVGFVALFCFIIVMGVFIYGKSDMNEQAKAALSKGMLADLPRTAEKVQVFQLGKISPQRMYIRFNASDADISKFIMGSKGLRSIEPREIKFNDPNLNFSYSDGAAPWFIVNIKKGKIYETPVLQKDYKDTVYIDEDNSIVYIKISRE